MGDHGSGWAGAVDGEEKDPSPLNNEYMPWSKSMVISRSSALLMVKPPKTSNAIDLKISERETQLIDIYPTILSAIGHSEKIPKIIHGIDVFDQISPERENILLISNHLGQLIPTMRMYTTYFIVEVTEFMI